MSKMEFDLTLTLDELEQSCYQLPTRNKSRSKLEAEIDEHDRSRIRILTHDNIIMGYTNVQGFIIPLSSMRTRRDNRKRADLHIEHRVDMLRCGYHD